MIFDFHAHFFPDNLAGGAIEALEKLSGIKANTAGTRSSLIESMRNSGIDAALNLPVVTNPDKSWKINEFSAIGNKAPVYSAGAMHPLTTEPEKLLEKVAGLGLKGIKMHPEYQSFDPLGNEVGRICGKCAELGLFIVFHAGADIAFKAPYKSNPAKFAELHRRFPSLKMILAHLGSWNMWEDVEREIAGLPIYLDTSFTCGIIDPSLMLSIIRKHGARHILFGSDSPWQSQTKSLESIRQLPLPESDKELILWDNAAELLGL